MVSDNFDLWSDEKTTVPESFDGDFKIRVNQGTITLHSRHDFVAESLEEFSSLNRVSIGDTIGNVDSYTMPATPNNAFVLRYAVHGMKTDVDKESAAQLTELANQVSRPAAKLSADGTTVDIRIPLIKHYKDLLMKFHAYPLANGLYRIGLTKVLDLETVNETLDTKFPRIRFHKNVLRLNREPLPGYDGTLDSLRGVPVSALNVVSANKQTRNDMRKSDKSIAQKMNSIGIENLYDLLFWLPRRHIDKTSPQDVRSLMEGETAVVLGKITSVGEMYQNPRNPRARGGAVFNIRVNDGDIRVTFFNQKWLAAKYKEGNEVLVTGKVSWWNRTLQISGTSIEHSEEAAALPVVPIYNQSPSKGLTTAFLLSAVRELISRMGDVKLPVYLEQEGDLSYYQALSSLHFPESAEKHKQAMETLAYYELVKMQVLIQDEKKDLEKRKGVVAIDSTRKLQAKALAVLPFKPTNDQKKAIVKVNKSLESSIASKTLLSADVGSGKTLVAQMGCFRAVGGGYQAAMLAPTEILARQLYRGLDTIVSDLEEKGEKVNVAFVSQGLKAAERKDVYKRLSSGEIDIVVGTHALMSDKVKFQNLGFVAIDEQQKFGTEQRNFLSNSREDGLYPDVLEMTATPIPRSTAQVFYGDMEFIEMKERPPGRLPIQTEWIQEDPVDFAEHLTNNVWFDVIQQAKLGNQTFVITPLVDESEKVDAASVERTVKSLQSKALSGLRIGYVTGKMKKPEQNEVMTDFKNKKYDVLVASTVVEVGVDVPDATRVVVLSAERIGASSLHQIRGRVGRNSKQSKCYLVSLGTTKSATMRMESLVRSTDGFQIAKDDLKLRGEGDIFSSNQSGQSSMAFASLAQHSKVVKKAQQQAAVILEGPHKDIAIADSELLFKSGENVL